MSERAAQDIFELTGSDVRGFNHVLRCDEVSHINKRHGKKGKADSSMRDINDLGRIAYVLNNYYEIIFSDRAAIGFRNKIGKHALSVLFVKRINGNVFAAEAITDSIKKKELYIETMYKARTSIYLAQKRESVVDDKNPRPNVHDASDSTSISILPQNEKNVNSLKKNNSGDQPKPPSFAEIVEQNKNYRPPQRPRTSGNGNDKKPPNNGSSGR